MPDTIDRYEIIGELGRGGMATVFHARDPRDIDAAVARTRTKGIYRLEW